MDDLLVEGLDKYFRGQYADAVHIWTRVLFLDRSHASARGYIDRARSAIVERERRAEESLSHVGALLDQGRTNEARAQLHQATSVLGEDERTAALRLGLERLERAFGGPPRIRVVADPMVVSWNAWLSTRVTVRAWLAAAAVVVVTVVLFSINVPGLGWDVGPAAVIPLPTLAAASVTVPSHAEVALVRARTLYSRGRLAEALQVLDRIEPEQIFRDETDRLRIDIQRLLLAAAGERRGPLEGPR